MNSTDEWQQRSNGSGPPPPGADQPYPGPPPIGYGPNGYPPQPPAKKRSKLLAAVFALLVPGTGHMYLGLMAKGIIIMLLLALNICGIVFFGVENSRGVGDNVLIIVLLSLLVPILYFYNLFDVLQQTDAVNERQAAGWPSANGWQGFPPSRAGGDNGQIPVVGVVLLAVGGVALFSTANTSWTRWLLHSSGSMAGAVILIALGAVVWLWEKRGRDGKGE